ncbi:hypothetical protein OE88DRAFT_1808553 [Heliocybe sulcata]|uniref:Uncharacterized protein n=1 Tax=Heliocybe sulcata TaxID=5364 RepID=A0A5C3N1X6_9AGAM|nr:hypothetical protein OE88DRAFT_1808553 [Heliocybe sulcata]
MDQSSITVEQLKHVTAEQVEEMVDTAVRAFAGDNAHRAMLGGNWSIHHMLFRGMVRASELAGEIYVVRNADKTRILSCGFWFRPGTGLFGTEEQKALGFNDFFDKLSPETQYWWKHPYPECFSNIIDGMWTKDEIAKRWWCFHLCTDPLHQNRGYAKAIVNFICEKAERRGEIIGLATPSELNVRKYVAMGLHERGHVFLDDPTDDQPAVAATIEIPVDSRRSYQKIPSIYTVLIPLNLAVLTLVVDRGTLRVRTFHHGAVPLRPNEPKAGGRT